MATINLSGLDDVVRRIDKLGSKMTETVDKMLNAGGYEMKAEQQNVLSTSHRHILTGSMHDKIGYTNPKGVGTGRQTTVYPRGVDGKKTSNARKGFILNYGTGERYTKKGYYRGKIVADHWFDYGVDAATPKVEDKMRQVFEEQINEIMEE